MKEGKGQGKVPRLSQVSAPLFGDLVLGKVYGSPSVALNPKFHLVKTPGKKQTIFPVVIDPLCNQQGKIKKNKQVEAKP